MVFELDGMARHTHTGIQQISQLNGSGPISPPIGLGERPPTGAYFHCRVGFVYLGVVWLAESFLNGTTVSSKVYATYKSLRLICTP